MSENKVETVAKKRLNLQQMIREGKPIWVMNKSGEYCKRTGKRHKAGIVIIQIGSGDTVDKVVVPPGPDPVCITDQVDSESLKSCRDLLRLCNNGVLDPLDPEFAEDYYTRNEARRALMEKKVHKAKFSVQELLGTETPQEVKESSVEIDPVIMGLLLKLKHDKMTVSEVIEKLNENFGNFSESDMEYLTRAASQDEIKKWAASQLDISRK
jgi:hypothetical protein